MSWPCLSRTVAAPALVRAVELASRVRLHAGLRSNDIEARYEGDISGFLRLLTWWLPMGVVRGPAQDFRRLDQRLEREASATSRWQRGYFHGSAE